MPDDIQIYKYFYCTIDPSLPDPDEASTPASPTNTDNEEESWQGYTTETAVDVLQKLITQSLTDELENRYDDYPEKTFEGN